MINKLMDLIKSTSPKGGKRGCLCEDGTYSSECCKGETINQGIGTTVGQSNSSVNNQSEVRVITSSNG
jgi:hypothetical protein